MVRRLVRVALTACQLTVCQLKNPRRMAFRLAVLLTANHPMTVGSWWMVGVCKAGHSRRLCSRDARTGGSSTDPRA